MNDIIATQTGHERISVNDWLEKAIIPWSSIVMVTLNFKASLLTDAGINVQLDDEKARSQVKRFGGEVDRAAFGSRTVQRFNRRVQRIPFLEYGHDRGWHCHVLLERPVTVDAARFQSILGDAWVRCSWSSSLDIREADLGSVKYLTKYRSKFEFEAWSDTLILEAMVLTTK